MGFITGWIVGKLKWLLVLAAIAGPISAIVGWTETDRVHGIVEKGIEAEARIVSATRKTGKRGSQTYQADLAWKDQAGQERRAEEVRVSGALARKLFRDNLIIVNAVRIKYLPEEPGRNGLVIVDDIQEQLDLDRFMMIGGGILAVIGLFGSAWIFGLFARLRRKPKEEFVRDGRAVMGPPP